jgi:beta-glucanase (GH16 family)
VSGPNWPAAGEEDIAEGLGQLTTNYHAPNVTDNSGPIPGTWSNQFHVYGMWRQATQALYYWDGNLVYTWTTSDDGQPQTLIVNVGCSDPSTCVTGAASEVDVDYVRAWQ